MSTGSEPFSLLIRVDGTKFVLLKDCLIKTLFKITTQKCKKSLLPVDEPEVEPALLFKQLERRTSTGCGLIPNLGRDVDQIFGQIIFMREKTLKDTNLVVSRHIKREMAHFRLTCTAQKRFCLNSLLLSLYRSNSLWVYGQYRKIPKISPSMYK